MKTATPHHLRILLTEDTPVNQTLAVRILEKQGSPSTSSTTVKRPWRPWRMSHLIWC